MKAIDLITTGIRLLVEQALTDALAAGGLHRPQPVDPAAAAARRLIVFGNVVDTVAARYGITGASICSAGRPQPQAEARQIACWILRRLYKWTEAEIAAAINRGDRTTVTHACRQVDRKRKADPAFATRLDEIRHALFSITGIAA